MAVPAEKGQQRLDLDGASHGSLCEKGRRCRGVSALYLQYPGIEVLGPRLFRLMSPEIEATDPKRLTKSCAHLRGT